MGLQNIIRLDPGSIVWTILTFLVLLWILSKFAWKPILKGLSDREAAIKGDLDTARREREESGRLLKEYQEQLAGAKKEAARIIQDAQEASAHVKEEGAAQTKAMTQQMLERAKAEIAREEESARKRLREHVADLTAQATSKLLGRVITREDHERLIRESLEETS
ncbi:MAG: F0F1 ATP synthase subunit B [Calditrichaeota bacterium]|nr:F0F1 ATP synthase subunit B [Calditrichota bacterium]